MSPENRFGYQGLVARVMSDVPDALRPIPSETHHLTLAFVGEIPESNLGNCVAGLAAVEELESFSFSLRQPRILMGRGKPRLIYVDIGDGSEKVSEVQAALVAHLSSSLPSLEIRPKPPHVTLARFKKNARRSQAEDVEGSISRHFDIFHPSEDRLSAVHLVKSMLTPAGPIYETVRQAPLPGDR